MDDNFISLQGHSVLITGASSGIGAAVALLASKRGARCFITGRDAVKLNATFAQLYGREHVAMAMELCEGNGNVLVNEAVNAVGKLSGVVHCAGIEKTLPFRMTTINDLREVMSINFEAYWEIAQAVLKKENYKDNTLSLVAVSSVSALYGAAGKTAYSASKSALIGFTKALAAEYARKNIRFNCVCPGYINTPMLMSVRKLYSSEEEFTHAIVNRHPLGLGCPQDVANAVVFLLSGESKWLTGSVLEVDGGYSVR